MKSTLAPNDYPKNNMYKEIVAI